jgi:hypothetical protein
MPTKTPGLQPATEFADAIVLSSPHERSQRVKDAQYTLNGNNFFKVDWLKSDVDGEWGIQSGQAADAARWALGYPDADCNSQVFGQPLFDYLRVDGNRKKLPAAYLMRRKTRLAAAQSVKAKALACAITQIGVEENPKGSNRQKFGAWYGLNGAFWCAIFVTYCQVVGGGDKKVFMRGSRSAWAYWVENMARASQYGLRITTNPEPGDVVVYHYHDGHTGIFEEWIDRPNGIFHAIEGNTSAGSDDNGGAVRRRQRALSWCPTVFVRLPS